MLIAWLARYGWPGDFAATTKATPLCDLLLIARRADSRAIGNTLMTSISGVLFVEFFAANEMTAVDVTFRMSRESVAGWRNGQGIHVMFEGEETANPPSVGESQPARPGRQHEVLRRSQREGDVLRGQSGTRFPVRCRMPQLLVRWDRRLS